MSGRPGETPTAAVVAQIAFLAVVIIGAWIIGGP